jgi:hypothetical protein
VKQILVYVYRYAYGLMDDLMDTLQKTQQGPLIMDTYKNYIYIYEYGTRPNVKYTEFDSL